MEDSQKQSQIIKFLDKNYIIKDDMILNKLGHQYWAIEVLRKLPIIFSLDEEYCNAIFEIWCQKYGYKDWRNVVTFSAKKLNINWNPEMAQEIAVFHQIDAEGELIAMLTERLTKEIDSQILRDLSENVKKKTLSIDEFFNLVKCIGYKYYTIYDVMSFKPRINFVSMKKQDIEYERQINPHWQDWF